MLVAYLSINVETEITVSHITKIASSTRKLQTSGKSGGAANPGVSAQLEASKPASQTVMENR
jgi:hypothetical protein